MLENNRRDYRGTRTIFDEEQIVDNGTISEVGPFGLLKWDHLPISYYEIDMVVSVRILHYHLQTVSGQNNCDVPRSGGMIYDK